MKRSALLLSVYLAALNGLGALPLAMGQTSLVDVRVSQSTDDATEAGGDVVDSDAKLEIGQMPFMGTRFLNVAVPAGRTIVSAYVEFVASDPNTQPTSLTIRGEAADNPTTFVDGLTSDISTRPQTIASVAWSVPNWTIGSTQQTPDISSIIQEIVNRPGWSSGNAMVIVFESTNLDGNRRADAYDGNPGTAPLLHIEFQSCSVNADCDDDLACTADACVAGACQNTIEPAGTVCGAAPTDCSAQDTCDGLGTCLANDLAAGTACPDDLKRLTKRGS